MASTILIDLTEIKRLKLSLNEYLALLSIKNIIDYDFTETDLGKLLKNEFVIKLSNNQYIPSPKAVTYFESSEMFEEFYNEFPHKVPGRFGEERPLRNASVNSNGALVTKGLFKSKTKGNKTLQRHIIDVLKAEVTWREANNSLQYMHNIDTWLRQNDYEKYEYLLDQDVGSNRKRL
ncbi:MAG: hypothetical protein ACOCV1_04140 [Bacillota bacterium]